MVFPFQIIGSVSRSQLCFVIIVRYITHLPVKLCLEIVKCIVAYVVMRFLKQYYFFVRGMFSQIFPNI